MKKEYKKLEFLGHDIDHVMEELSKYKEKGELISVEFNGQTLYSDVDDLDSAYKKITGSTKSEFDEEIRKINEKYEEELRIHKEAIPELTVEWIEKGKKILDEKYLEFWERCVPIRLSDLYRGFELGACLEIVEKLNGGCDLETAKKIIWDQGHSGMSFGLVKAMVKSFCDRGEEFSNYLKD